MSETEKQMPVGCADLLCCPFCGFEEPEIGTHQNWCPNCGAKGPDELDAWGLEGEPTRPRSAQEAWNTRHDDRWTIEAFKAAANTILSALVRKWESEGERCGEEGRNSDEEWNDDGSRGEQNHSHRQFP